jgi:hypothetical protein
MYVNVVFSLAYLRHVGPISLQYRIPFAVGMGKSISFDVATGSTHTMPSYPSCTCIMLCILTLKYSLVHLTTLYQHEFLALLTITSYVFHSTGMAYVAALLLMNNMPEEVWPLITLMYVINIITLI